MATLFTCCLAPPASKEKPPSAGVGCEPVNGEGPEQPISPLPHLPPLHVSSTDSVYSTNIRQPRRLSNADKDSARYHSIPNLARFLALKAHGTLVVSPTTPKSSLHFSRTLAANSVHCATPEDHKYLVGLSGSWEVLSEVGQGTFGRADLVRVVGSNGQPYLAVLKSYPLSEDWTRAQAEREHDLLQRCGPCPFIVHLFSSCLLEEPGGKTSACMLLEWARGGDMIRLMKVVAKHRATLGLHQGAAAGPGDKDLFFPEPCLRFYAACILLALDFLHSHGLMHRDVKPSNLLLQANGYLLLSDFNMARALRDGLAFFSVGTQGYMAPEVADEARAECGYPPAADLWSLGATLFTLASCEECPEDGSAPCLPDGWSTELRDLLTALFRREPEQRPSAAQAMAHAWFRGLDWQALREQRLAPPEDVPWREALWSV